MLSGTLAPSRRMAENRVSLISRLSVSPNSYCFDEPDASMPVARYARSGHWHRTRRLDASGQIARIVPPEAGFSQRSEQVLQRLETQKVERLIGDFEAHLAVGTVARARHALLLVAGLLDGDLPFVDHLLHEIVEQLLHLFGREVLETLHHLAHAFVVEKIALFERLLDSLFQVLQRMLVPFAKGHVLRVESALQ